jgi:choline-sulfatase
LKSCQFNILNRVTLIASATLVVMGSAACQRSGQSPARPRAPRDLVVVTIDTLRADRVGVCGGPADLTPALDALGHRGAVFLDATAHVPLTLPSHASILTGRYPPHHGIHDNEGFSLEASVPTLATALHDAGYHTAAFVSSFVLRGSTGLARGFDAYDDRFEGAGRSHLTFSSLERRGPEVGRAAAQWIARAPRPFFLWVHFYDPHAPYDPPPAFAEKFPGRPYDAEVAAADFGLATILEALSPERQRETVIIATSDHGESLGEHGELEHGVLLYEAALHVPLVIAGPGVAAGTMIRRQVRHVDLLPTALELIGVKAPGGLDGTSLAALLAAAPGSDTGQTPTPQKGSDTGQTPTLSYAESRLGELHFGWSPIRSVRDGTWKYIDAPEPELYDVSRDAAERDNRREARRDTAAALARALGEMTTGPRVQAPAAATDADAAARLRALGYVSGRMELDARQRAGHPDPKREIGGYVAYVTAFNEAMAHLENGGAAEAEKRFRALARSFPRAFEAHQYLARALDARGASGEATRELDAAIALSPGQAVLYFDAARTLASAKKFDAALARAAEGLRIEPASFYGWLTRGQIMAAAGRRDEAADAYRHALTLNPSLAIAHLELGRLAEARGDRQTARAEYEQALAGDALLTEARQALDRLSQ